MRRREAGQATPGAVHVQPHAVLGRDVGQGGGVVEPAHHRGARGGGQEEGGLARRAGVAHGCCEGVRAHPAVHVRGDGVHGVLPDADDRGGPLHGEVAL